MSTKQTSSNQSTTDKDIAKTPTITSTTETKMPTPTTPATKPDNTETKTNLMPAAADFPFEHRQPAPAFKGIEDESVNLGQSAEQAVAAGRVKGTPEYDTKKNEDKAA